jgi:hypothetical protein
MFMRFRGGGVGHQSTRDATNHFLKDRTPTELARAHASNDADEELENVNDESNGDDEGTEADEEQDFGYENPFGEEGPDSDKEEEDEAMVDEWEDLDILGPEDGETQDGVETVEGLGFAEL